MRKQILRNAFFGGSSESIAALNLGNHALKGLISRSGTISDYFIETSSNLSEALKAVWEKKRLSVKKVRLSLKSPSCLVRYFSFPKMEKKRLRQALFYELNKFIPFPPQDVYFDYSVLKDSTPGHVFILLAAAKKNYIDGILDIFSKLNLKVADITLDSICLINVFCANYPQDNANNICILDIGHKLSTMTILQKGFPYITRDVKFSAADVLQVISRIKNIPPGEINAWIASPGRDEFLELARDSIASLCKEMKSSFDYFEVNSAEHVSRVYLTGGMALAPGIERLFNEFLDLETLRLNPVPASGGPFKLDIASPDFDRAKDSFAAAFGLLAG